MQVVEKNFEEFYGQMKVYLPEADFISLDLEMTGIKTFRPEVLSDTPQDRYTKMSSACSNKYKIIQVGLCLFTKKDWGFVARPYNIYVFPRESYGYSPQIILDSSTCDFHRTHHLDWNKCLTKALPTYQ